MSLRLYDMTAFVYQGCACVGSCCHVLMFVVNSAELGVCTTRREKCSRQFSRGTGRAYEYPYVVPTVFILPVVYRSI